MDAEPPAAANNVGRFIFHKQSSLAPVGAVVVGVSGSPRESEVYCIPDEIRLMYMAGKGDLTGIRDLIASGGVDVNFCDGDGRTALHVAACEGLANVVEMLIDHGARVSPKDRWGSTPLADAIHYHNLSVVEVLEKHGAEFMIAPMHVERASQVPEYEIDPKELDYTNSASISKGTFHVAVWRGTQVAVKQLDNHLITEDKVMAFRDELALLQLVRHPNVVQFLGAVTQSIPMSIVTEYLPKGDLRAFLECKKVLELSLAVKFALDISRGMNYLHEHTPGAIVHRDLEPSNILLDDAGHLKVADFGVSMLLRWKNTVREDKTLSFYQDTSCRYVAPEVIRNEEYGTKVDVFSFALILQEMIEGRPPFYGKQDSEVLQAYVCKERPPFREHLIHCPRSLRQLIEQCWSDKPADRPPFKEIIMRLTDIQEEIIKDRKLEGLHRKVLRMMNNLWQRDQKDDSVLPSP